MNELQEKLRKVLDQIASMNALGDNLNDEDADKLDSLNSEAVKLEARIKAGELTEKHKADEQERIEREQKEAVEAALKAQKADFEAAGRRLPFEQGVPYQTQYSEEAKYDHLTDAELSLFIETATALKLQQQTQGKDISVNFPAALKAMSRRVAKVHNDDKNADYIKGAFKRMTASHIEPTVEAVDAAIKAATDPMYTGGSLIGSDWVGTAYSMELWEKLRGDTSVVSRIPAEVIPDGYSNKTWPLESTDMTWYKVAEASASDATLKVPAATITASQMATANKNITVSKLGARGLYTEELNEDSLIRFAPQLRAQLETSGAEILESAVIDGDTETSANKNINDIAGTPAATDYFLVWDGFRKLALVTNTGNSRSAAGGFVIEDYKDTLKLLGTAGLGGSDPSKVAFIQDFNTMWSAMELAEIKTKDTFTQGVIEDGFLRRIYRVEVIDSFHMHHVSNAAGYERKANTSGKIDVDTTTNNTTGSILAVRFDQWKLAYKRRMTIETTRIANADSWEIVALMRMGLGYRDNEASAITYNVSV